MSNENKMKLAIEERMKSDIWDKKIANVVLDKKQTSIFKISIAGGSAIAAILFIAIFFNINTKNPQEKYQNKFASKQIEGVYNEEIKDGKLVIAKNQKKQILVFNKDYAHIDPMIMETLSKR